MEPIAGLLGVDRGDLSALRYSVCSTSVRYTIDPRMISFAPTVARPQGTWREGTKDELPLLESIYRAFTKRRNGYCIGAGDLGGTGAGHQGTGYGRRSVRAEPDAIYEERGEPKGYIAYAPKYWTIRARPRGPGATRRGTRLRVANADGYRAIWEFLKTFDLANRIWMNTVRSTIRRRTSCSTRGVERDASRPLLGRILDVERRCRFGRMAPKAHRLRATRRDVPLECRPVGVRMSGGASTSRGRSRRS